MYFDNRSIILMCVREKTHEIICSRENYPYICTTIQYKGMKKETPSKDYRKIRPMARAIAEKTASSLDYVRKVLSGERVGKTDRAHKYALVVAEADRLLEAINQ